MVQLDEVFNWVGPKSFVRKPVRKPSVGCQEAQRKPVDLCPRGTVHVSTLNLVRVRALIIRSTRICSAKRHIRHNSTAYGEQFCASAQGIVLVGVCTKPKSLYVVDQSALNLNKGICAQMQKNVGASHVSIAGTCAGSIVNLYCAPME